MGSWFGKLLPIISSMDNFEPQQATEPGRKAPDTNGEGANPEESHDDDIFKDGASNGKRKSVPTPSSRKKFRGQTETLFVEMKDTMNTPEIITSDTSSKELLHL